jgi:hypothetical protein
MWVVPWLCGFSARTLPALVWEVEAPGHPGKNQWFPHICLADTAERSLNLLMVSPAASSVESSYSSCLLLLHYANLPATCCCRCVGVRVLWKT